jgi:hypothetical protein
LAARKIAVGKIRGSAFNRGNCKRNLVLRRKENIGLASTFLDGRTRGRRTDKVQDGRIRILLLHNSIT